MNTPEVTASRWSTASFGDAADTSPMELNSLGEHLSSCQSASGKWFALRSRADVMHGYVASRFITTVVLAGGLLGAGLLIL